MIKMTGRQREQDRGAHLAGRVRNHLARFSPLSREARSRLSALRGDSPACQCPRFAEIRVPCDQPAVQDLLCGDCQDGTCDLLLAGDSGKHARLAPPAPPQQ